VLQQAAHSGEGQPGVHLLLRLPLPLPLPLLVVLRQRLGPLLLLTRGAAAVGRAQLQQLQLPARRHDQQLMPLLLLLLLLRWLGCKMGLVKLHRCCHECWLCDEDAALDLACVAELQVPHTTTHRQHLLLLLLLAVLAAAAQHLLQPHHPRQHHL
jgi:hypothetical protein